MKVSLGTGCLIISKAFVVPAVTVIEKAFLPVLAPLPITKSWLATLKP